MVNIYRCDDPCPPAGGVARVLYKEDMGRTNAKLYRNLPDSPGVYLMKNSKGEILYIGKAGNLRRRVSSYFNRANETRIEEFLGRIYRIDYKKTDTAIEALILEAELIRKHKPIFNVKEKDDKSFLWVEITKEKFPRVLLARGADFIKTQSYEAKLRKIGFGPFTSASSIREALRIIRRIFPYSLHDANMPARNASERVAGRQARANDANIANEKREFAPRFADSHSSVDLHHASPRRPCLDYEIGLCPGTCVGAADRGEYLKNIKNIKLFFKGKKKKIINSLAKEMTGAAKKLDFEKAQKLRRQIFALQHIQDIALINDSEIGNWKLGIGNSAQRIEGYDISNISGASATGSMVVFMGDKPDKNQYRKFKIRTLTTPDDVGMLKEVLGRRFKRNPEVGGWPLPDLILIDGGKGQVNVARAVLEEFGLRIPIVGLAKGPTRKKVEFIGQIPKGIKESTLVKVRNEAHRFAISYHKKLRGEIFIGK